MDGFHFASLFGNAKCPITVADMVNAARTEFKDWCTAFSTSLSSNAVTPIIRLLLGEAISICRTLHLYATTGALKQNLPVSPWEDAID